MLMALGRPARGTLVAATLFLAAMTGAGTAAAAPADNNGRHLGQESTASTSSHGAAVRSQHAQAAQAKTTAPGRDQGHGHAAAQGGKKSDHAAAKAAKPSDHPQAHTAAPANAANGSAKPASTTRGSAGDPPGNNGTVKIAEVGDLDGIPDNNPHPGCTFEVQWYGFDAGSDVVSTVSFTPQAPTSDVSIGVDGPTSVPVGEDAASGAGTATGLDAVATYHLSFSGGAPAAQGYHVRLTVATPRSLGNDTKTKVFWVEPCAADAPAAVPASEPASSPATATAALGTPPRPQASSTPMGTSLAAPAALAATPAPDRFASPAADTAASTEPGASGASGVPTAIDAGERHTLLHQVTSSPWGMGLIGLGIVLVLGAAVMARRRA